MIIRRLLGTRGFEARFSRRSANAILARAPYATLQNAAEAASTELYPR
jgi:hypothetical protein